MQNKLHQEIYQIFISYRRNGSDAHARVFYEKLRERGYSVFLDFESLFSGGFEKRILSAVEECTDFLLLLPKDGLDRCAEENDLLRKEIRQAIQCNKNIIPVFIGGFKMPEKAMLPADIAELADEHGFDCSMEYFGAVFERLLRNLNSTPENEDLYKALMDIRARALSVKHAYFKRWTSIKLNRFLADNDMFFDGTNWTNPHSEETFGIVGIGYTQRCLKATTAVSDYWEDDFSKAYLEKQHELIEKGVTVTRIFILEKGKTPGAVRQMQYQYEMGIKVYYIEKGDEYIDPEWLSEDYLIQDDELLVQIYCDTHQFSSQNQNTEEITMDPVKVQLKVERFQRILERSVEYKPCEET